MKKEKLYDYYFKQAEECIQMISDPYQKAKLSLYAIEVLSCIEKENELNISNGVESIKKESAKNNNFEEQPIENSPFAEEANELENGPVDLPSQPELPEREKKIGYNFDNKSEAIDITEAYYLIKNDLPEDEKIKIASRVTTYSCLDVYKKLVNVSDSYNKAILADAIITYNYDIINRILYDFNDKITNQDIYEFMNDNVIDAFLEYIRNNQKSIDIKYPA